MPECYLKLLWKINLTCNMFKMLPLDYQNNGSKWIWAAINNKSVHNTWYQVSIKYFLAHLAQRAKWAILITWRLSVVVVAFNFLYNHKNWKFFGRILVSCCRRRRRPKTFGFRTLTLVKVNRNLWNLNTRFMTIKGRLGLILGVLVPTV